MHFNKLIKPKKSDVYDNYWLFANARFDIFKNRLTNSKGPWTDDSVLKENRFTNVFRASDRVSQFLINLQYNEEEELDVFFKTLIFKIFNKIETYEYLEKELSEIKCASFSVKEYDSLLTNRFLEPNTIYSAAYIMPSAGKYFGYKYKHTNHLALLDLMIKDRLFDKIKKCKSLESIYKLLLGYPSLGQFLAFQYTIDLNYSVLTDFSEMDFVVAGPGAKNGIQKCFKSLGDYSFEDVIKMVTESQEEECERLGIESPSLGGRKLQLIDCQNLFCEVDKYLRVTNPELSQDSGRIRIKQKFKVAKGPIDYFFPPKWNVNLK